MSKEDKKEGVIQIHMSGMAKYRVVPKYSSHKCQQAQEE